MCFIFVPLLALFSLCHFYVCQSHEFRFLFTTIFDEKYSHLFSSIYRTSWIGFHWQFSHIHFIVRALNQFFLLCFRNWFRLQSIVWEENDWSHYNFGHQLNFGNDSGGRFFFVAKFLIVCEMTKEHLIDARNNFNHLIIVNLRANDVCRNISN